MDHHLTDAILLAYSAGTLPEAYALVVAVHLSLCDDCRATAESWDAVGGEVLEGAAREDEGEAPMAPGAFAATLARIDAAGPRAPEPAPRPAGAFPGPLAAYAGGGPEAVRWRRVGGGVAQAILPTAGGATARLLRIPGGGAVPDHGHRGTELTLVLQGAFSDADGRYARGDVEIADEATSHAPVAEPGEDCICLAATDAPLRFRALAPRIAQPFLRI